MVTEAFLELSVLPVMAKEAVCEHSGGEPWWLLLCLLHHSLLLYRLCPGHLLC